MNYLLDIFIPVEELASIQWNIYDSDSLSLIKNGEWPSIIDASNDLEYIQNSSLIRVFIPGEWLSVWDIELPKSIHKEINSILPSLLEDELSQDIEDLHFSILCIDNETITAAVIDKEKIKLIYHFLNECNPMSVTVLPDWMALPYGHLQVNKNRCLMRINKSHGWCTDISLAPDLLKAHIDETQHPISIAMDKSLSPTLSKFIEQQKEKFHLITSEISSMYIASDSDLLNGKWKKKINYQQHWSYWKKTLVTSCFLLTLFIGAKGVTLWSLNEKINQIQTMTEKHFLELFPEQKRIVNLRAQINNSLSKYKKNSSNDGLLTLLPLIAEVLKDNNQSLISIYSLQYDQTNHEISLQLKTNDFSVFEKLRQSFEKNFTVKIDTLFKEKKHVIGKVTLNRETRNEK